MRFGTAFFAVRVGATLFGMLSRTFAVRWAFVLGEVWMNRERTGCVPRAPDARRDHAMYAWQSLLHGNPSI
jgi:hypothetical protein